MNDQCGTGKQWEDEVLDNLDINREKVNLDPYYTPCTKIISRWITDQRVKDETTKIPKNNIGQYLQDLEIEEAF